ncbi:hypothetical protein ABZ897_60360 [Nonomuraea sp. NPDC046802]|uniref:hypothetical protein n=1 Tax=Nonomuraea sp. NPDC046802 TaxID=3154919 RepID=UPI0033CBFD7B
MRIDDGHAIAHTFVRFCLDEDLPPLTSFMSDRQMLAESAVITWRWDCYGWKFIEVEIRGRLLEDGAPTDLYGWNGQDANTLDEHKLPVEYQALIEANRPHNWTPLPAPSSAAEN